MYLHLNDQGNLNVSKNNMAEIHEVEITKKDQSRLKNS